MPELPEVETVKRGLERAVLGKTIASVMLRRADLRTPFPKDFAAILTGRRINALERRAKYILFQLDNEKTIIAHLGMSGKFTVHSGIPNAFGTHDHAVFAFTDASAIIFNDPRRFGLMTLSTPSEWSQHPLFIHLGPEPLSDAFNANYLSEALKGKKAPIKTTLMDQTIVVGVGNIYASEALFLAGIHPQTQAGDAVQYAPKLVKHIQTVLNDALASGGSSLRDFFHADGNAGYFQHHFKVYDREGKPCTTCKTPIVRMVQAGRSTFYCGKCQR